MKIVGFEANNGVRLGVVEGDDVIDGTGVDKNVPSDLGEFCAGAAATSRLWLTCQNAPASAPGRWPD
jgi:hypothetical protein